MRNRRYTMLPQRTRIRGHYPHSKGKGCITDSHSPHPRPPGHTFCESTKNRRRKHEVECVSLWYQPLLELGNRTLPHGVQLRDGVGPLMPRLLRSIEVEVRGFVPPRGIGARACWRERIIGSTPLSLSVPSWALSRGKHTCLRAE